MTTQLTITRFAELETLKSWFASKDTCYPWGGPGVRFPFTDETFLEDIQWQSMPTYSLLSDAGELIAFGQYYEKLGRCHLARLAVAPSQRGHGVGQQFIAELMQIGMTELKTEECSLFVLDYNSGAMQCYRALGFSKCEYPTNHETYQDVDFMVYSQREAGKNSPCST